MTTSDRDRTRNPLDALTSPGLLATLPRDMRPLAGRLRRLARRFTLVGAATVALRVLFVGVCVATAWLLVDRLMTATGVAMLPGLLVPIGAALLTGIVVGWLVSRTSPGAAAVKADIALGLRERLSTALVVDGRSAFEAAVRRDALARLERADWDAVAPFRWPWQGTASFAVGALLVAGALWLPAMRWLDAADNPVAPQSNFEARPEHAIQVLTDNQRLMDQLAEQIGTEGTKDLLDKIRRVIEDLKARPQGAMSDEEQRRMIEQLADLEAEAEARRDELEALQRDSEALKDGPPGPENGDAADDFKESLRNEDYRGAGDALEDMKRDLREMQNEAPGSQRYNELMEKLRGQGDKLDQLQQQMDGSNPMKEQLDKLADMLEQLDEKTLQDLMDQMQGMQDKLDDLGDGGKTGMNLDMLEMLLEQLKNSKEQFGQCPPGGGGQSPPPPGSGDGAKPGEQGNSGGAPGLSEQQRLQMLQMLSNSPGSGGGSGNNGAGGAPGESDGDDMESTPWRLDGEMHDGSIIATMPRMGIPETGEARARYEAEWQSATREADDSMRRNGLPPEYRPGVRRYYDTIQPRGDD